MKSNTLLMAPPELAKIESVRKNTETEAKVLGYKPDEVRCFIV